MAITMGRLLPASDEERVDYGPMLGFGAPNVRVDPHTHEAPPAQGTNLRKVVDILRSKSESDSDTNR